MQSKSRSAARRNWIPCLDFAFRFTVVDGKGVVTVGGEKPGAAESAPPERVR